MSSSLLVSNFSSGPISRNVTDIIAGSAKLMIQYNTTTSPYYTAIEKSHGVSSVTDVQTGIQEFSPSLSLGNGFNSRPCLMGVSTNDLADSFGYHGSLYRGSGYRVAYYTTGWAAAQYVSCIGL